MGGSAVLGVDIGTTATKVTAFDAERAVSAVVEGAYPLEEPEVGWAVQDPQRVVATVLDLVEQGLKASPGAQGIAFSTAMHSLVGLDDAGRPLTPLVTWGDTRAAEQAERLRREHPELHGRTGTPLHPMSPLCKLVWFRECEPET